MNVTMTELAVAALAAWQVVEVVHHSSLFATTRAWAETRDDFVGRLVTCPFCLSVWVGFATATVVLLSVPEWDATAAYNGIGGLFLLSSTVYFTFAIVTVLRLLKLLRGRARFAATVYCGTVVWGMVTLIGLMVYYAPAGTPYGVWFLTVHALKAVVLGFAVARLANLGNDLTHEWCRSPIDYTQTETEEEGQDDDDGEDGDDVGRGEDAGTDAAEADVRRGGVRETAGGV